MVEPGRVSMVLCPLPLALDDDWDNGTRPEDQDRTGAPRKGKCAHIRRNVGSETTSLARFERQVRYDIIDDIDIDIDDDNDDGVLFFVVFSFPLFSSLLSSPLLSATKTINKNK